jgi:hypothetical protein
MLDLAQSILLHVGSCSKLISHPLPQDDPRDITLAGQVLDCRLGACLDDKLAHPVDYFRIRFCEQRI